MLRTCQVDRFSAEKNYLRYAYLVISHLTYLSNKELFFNLHLYIYKFDMWCYKKVMLFDIDMQI